MVLAILMVHKLVLMMPTVLPLHKHLMTMMMWCASISRVAFYFKYIMCSQELKTHWRRNKTMLFRETNNYGFKTNFKALGMGISWNECHVAPHRGANIYSTMSRCAPVKPRRPIITRDNPFQHTLPVSRHKKYTKLIGFRAPFTPFTCIFV